MSGWEVLAELRQRRPRPFEFDELIARMYAVIRRSAGQPAPQIRLGEVTIDTAGPCQSGPERTVLVSATIRMTGTPLDACRIDLGLHVFGSGRRLVQASSFLKASPSRWAAASRARS